MPDPTRLAFLVAASLAALLLGCSMSGGSHAGTANQRPDAATSPRPSLIGTEGMWLPNALPTTRMTQVLGFAPSPEWQAHLRLASLNVGGASGSFVSPDGLILTNHHVALGGLQAISRPDADYVNHGFLAKGRADEIKLPGYAVSSLVSIEDVTARVTAAVPKTLSPDDAVKARHAVIADIERESKQSTKLESRVVELYGGALYHLYRSKRYDDVRLVFAPELGAAFFGGDPDNFEYPRYCLDVSLMRAYENGQPAKVEHYLKWSTTGVADGEPVFVSGHPGHTDRLLPSAILQAMRDRDLPLNLQRLERAEKVLLDYGSRSPEAKRQAEGNLFGAQNSLKVVRPRLKALQQTDLITRKQREEAALRAAALARPDLRDAASAWDRIAAAEAASAELHVRAVMLEGAAAFNTGLFHDARTLVRLATEDAKPDAERLPEFTQAKRAQLEHRLLADAPTYPDLEIAKLASSLTWFQEKLGPTDPTVTAVLAGKSAQERAEQLVHGTKLGDIAERRRLYTGGAAAIADSTDSMIQLAKLTDPESRRIRKEVESRVSEPLTRAESDVNRLRFALLGTDTYPDATGTLRFSFGFVRSYPQDGQTLPPWTTFQGAFDHEKEHAAKPPYVLPEKYHAAHDRLALATPLDFVSTNDITGGNSGSPVVNRAGEFVGIIFDSNRQGVTNDFAYTDEQARAIAVDARGIVEALRKIYGADELAAELLGK